MIPVPPPPGIVPRFLMTPFDLYDHLDHLLNDPSGRQLNFSLMMDAEAPGGRRRGMGHGVGRHQAALGLPGSSSSSKEEGQRRRRGRRPRQASTVRPLPVLRSRLASTGGGSLGLRRRTLPMRRSLPGSRREHRARRRLTSWLILWRNWLGPVCSTLRPRPLPVVRRIWPAPAPCSTLRPRLTTTTRWALTTRMSSRAGSQKASWPRGTTMRRRRSARRTRSL